MIISRTGGKITKEPNINTDDEEFNYWSESLGNHKDNIFSSYTARKELKCVLMQTISEAWKNTASGKNTPQDDTQQWKQAN